MWRAVCNKTPAGAFVLILTVLMAACTPTPAVTPSPLPPAQGGFAFGVEYGNLDGGVLGQPRRASAEVYASFGATWVKFTDIAWGQIVPHSGLTACNGYSWRALDGWVREWQQAGFQIQMVLRSKSDWATMPSYRSDLVGGFGRTASTPPKPELWNAYGDFVQCVVERYDGDGQADMPGLRRPIVQYEIESEAGVEIFWQGTPEEYLRLLQLAHERIEAANPTALVIASGVGIPELFDDGADAGVFETRITQWRRRLANNPEGLATLERALNFVALIADHPEAFDLVEGHWLTDYKAIYGGLGWIRAEMARRGYEKPVWAGDATSALNLMVAPAFFEQRPFPQADLLRLRGLVGVGGILNDPKHADHPAVMRWFRAEQASLTVKKLVVGMALGLEGVNLCCLQDWPAWSGFPYQGLTDERQQPRPALYSYRLVVQKLSGFDAVESLAPGAREVSHSTGGETALGRHIVAYRFGVAGRPIVVLWRDDGRSYLPEQAEPSSAVDLPWPAGAALVTHIITADGQTEPASAQLSSSNGQLRLTVDSRPVFVEVQNAAGILAPNLAR